MSHPTDLALDPADTATFRHVLGHFCTGVVVVTAMDGDSPAGFACQSFSALSLDPPLVLFCPASTSRTWPVIERAGHFAVNVLAHSQREVSTVFGRSRPDKFTATGWRLSPGGAPVLDSVPAWLDCILEAVHDGGDHVIAVGRVTALGTGPSDRPLLFYRGGYTVTESAPVPTVPHEEFITWVRPGDWL
ncbi:3-hydroxy-9,10-secoandrosta-1,3,5(10)-triene-9,17-dione monooxygenase reductase subunit [Actinomadura violacea]|uniref:Flavin reductase family protein n=1 Tax=Actinomadura violacea TaxID=2819934 RepID=A0ABS3S459_9ACTN|nr:3-hydroxy-9,10-secoandrosta-1,3,5(10)-triene-9,17-dione monooxygenase reductase subunit [Actinomadura violacea]MBO2463533.1 flavin reductase family protein [Actinomadura violacea]